MNTVDKIFELRSEMRMFANELANFRKEVSVVTNKTYGNTIKLHQLQVETAKMHNELDEIVRRVKRLCPKETHSRRSSSNPIHIIDPNNPANPIERAIPEEEAATASNGRESYPKESGAGLLSLIENPKRRQRRKKPHTLIKLEPAPKAPPEAPPKTPPESTLTGVTPLSISELRSKLGGGMKES